MALLPVNEATKRVLAGAHPLQAERVPLEHCYSRVLATDLIALRTQPPFAMSAMDGYAVRAEDAVKGAKLTVIGESAAGHPFASDIKPHECVRIFTGAPLPPSADAILIQENAEREGDTITLQEPVSEGRYVRPAGLDFTKGEVLLPRLTKLNPAQLALAASANHPTLSVLRKPKVAIIATGDELQLPGTDLKSGEIIASNSYGVAAQVLEAGGTPLDLGIAKDSVEALRDCFRAAQDAKADIIITLGGASVGDHDLVQKTLGMEGLTLDFYKIAMRPGKPMIFGHLGDAHVLGLPGNPVSSMVCGTLFLQPLIKAMLGQKTELALESVKLGGDLPPKEDDREEYMRGTLEHGGKGQCIAHPYPVQDSSKLADLARSDGLIVKKPDGYKAILLK